MLRKYSRARVLNVGGGRGQRLSAIRPIASEQLDRGLGSNYKTRRESREHT